MTILTNDSGKIIKISLSDKRNIMADHTEKRVCYDIELPKITATNKDDAEIIQTQVNTFVTKLCHELLKK